ncbi:transcription initiation factor IID, 31kD subunit-domain-containing protein [Naematelia encephala]|uniref:Transcription initiation factor IID, 31kD subunit-domain-containing protein n=1 Tax=Naematelia encephala TaxID=71784 RepID=A0A1Y2BHD9_9TREE|nr:transcription initiation factor IID, 31kD subunit-domain-containing protein [Naematelia encephala]
MTTAPRPLPRDGRLIALILASKGIEDADERVIHQLLDFTYRYTADVLQSAQSLADHAARPGASKIEAEDIELAIDLRKRSEFFEPPPRDYLATLAHDLNSQPLPILPETFDILRLPPPHHRLAEVNFDIVPEAGLVLDDPNGGGASGSEDDDEDDDEEDDDEARTEDGDRVNGAISDDAAGSDDEMEAVPIAAPVRIEEDYDD